MKKLLESKIYFRIVALILIAINIYMSMYIIFLIPKAYLLITDSYPKMGDVRYIKNPVGLQTEEYIRITEDFKPQIQMADIIAVISIILCLVILNIWYSKELTSFKKGVIITVILGITIILISINSIAKYDFDVFLHL